jgi:F420H(2)-dependent quinone reductase
VRPTATSWSPRRAVPPSIRLVPQVGTATLRARARTATGEERARLWQQAVGFWPPYADYQHKAGAREIPIVVLDATA